MCVSVHVCVCNCVVIMHTLVLFVRMLSGLYSQCIMYHYILLKPYFKEMKCAVL